MKLKILISLAALALVLSACRNSDRQETVADNSGESVPDSAFVHLVFFDLVDSLDSGQITSFLDALEGLREIEQVNGFFAGPHLNVDDKRAMKQFDICMQMRFNSKEEYKHYQSDPRHLALKKTVAPFLKSSPRTYDYTIN